MKIIVLWIIEMIIRFGQTKKWFKNPEHDDQFTINPYFDDAVSDHIIGAVNKSIKLQCYIYNVDFSKIVITWWKEGGMQEITFGEKTRNKRYKLTRSFPEDWSLEIINVKPADSGNYICQINLIELKEKKFRLEIIDIMKTNQKQFQDLNYVKDEAFRTKSRKSVIIYGNSIGIAGEPFSLSCTVIFTDSFNDASVQWVHNDTKNYITSSDNIDISLRWEGSNIAHSVLTISKLYLSHTGVWRCLKVTDIQIEPKESSEIKVIVKDSEPMKDHRKHVDYRTTNSHSCWFQNPLDILFISRCLVLIVLNNVYFRNTF